MKKLTTIMLPVLGLMLLTEARTYSSSAHKLAKSRSVSHVSKSESPTPGDIAKITPDGLTARSNLVHVTIVPDFASLLKNQSGAEIGYVNNDTNSILKYVEVIVEAVDDKGLRLDSYIENTVNLQPHEKWRFKIPMTEDDVPTFKIVSVTVRK